MTEIRNSVISVLLAALGYAPDDGSGTAAWEIDRRLKAAMDAGHVVRNSRGHYAVSRSYFDLIQKRNSRSRSIPAVETVM